MHQRRDEGVSLVETVVAMAVFAVVATVSAGLLGQALRVTRSNDQRVVAANLAAQHIEQLRSLRALDIPDGAQSQDVPVGSTVYTVTRNANYVSSGTSASLCTGSDNALAFKLVTVTVTWPDMRGVKPVRSDTLRALGLGADGADTSRGTAAVALQTAAGGPFAGVVVTVSPAPPSGATRTTGLDGCAVFSGLAPGTYTASVNQPDHTGRLGDQAVTLPAFSVAAGQVTRTTQPYDRAGALRATFTHPAGWGPPPTLGLTLRHPYDGEVRFPDCALATAPPKQCVSGSPRTATRVFPGLYGVWAGVCAVAPSSPPTAQVSGGRTADVSVPVAPLTVDLRSSTGAPLAGSTLYASAVTGTTCTVTHALTADATGTVQTSLPSGTWRLSLTADGSGAPSSGWPTVTLDANATSSTIPRVTVTAP